MDLLKKLFEITVYVEKPIVVGQDDYVGRRQLIPIISGELKGTDIYENTLTGTVMAGGIDSQIIRPNGICELSARYGVLLTDGQSFYIENNGIRTVPDEYVEKVVNGEFIDPDKYYFCTQPKFEVYSKKLDWLTKVLFICRAKRLPDQVILSFYRVENK